jgi:hypothetical protein
MINLIINIESKVINRYLLLKKLSNLLNFYLYIKYNN